MYWDEHMYTQMYTNSNDFCTTAEYTTAKEIVLREMSDKVQVDADIQKV